MRQITTWLLAEQQKKSAKPYVRVWFTSYDGKTELRFTTVGQVVGGVESFTPRLVSVTQTEEPFGGTLQITLRNHDKLFTSLDLKGYTVQVGWGYYKSASDLDYVESPKFWVTDQHDISEEGELLTTLYCMDSWLRLAYEGIMTGASRIDGTIVGTFTFNEQVVGATSGKTAVVLSQSPGSIIVKSASGDFTPKEVVEGQTSKATITVTTWSAASAGVTAGWNLASIGQPVAYPIFYILRGLLQQAGRGTLVMDTTELYIDDTPGYITQVGDDLRNIIHNLLSMTKSVIRFRPDAPHIMYRNNDANLQTRAGGGSAYITGYFTPGETVKGDQSGATARLVYQGIGYIVMEAQDGTFIAAESIVGANGSIYDWGHLAFSPVDYQYDSEHAFFRGVRQQGLTIPNRIFVMPRLPDAAGSAPTADQIGYADDAESVAAIGPIVDIRGPESFDDLNNFDLVQHRATAAIALIKAEKNQGSIIAPMNCAQELHDIVQCLDTRSGLTINARVGGLIRKYNSGYVGGDSARTYTIEIRLGGLVTSINTSSPTLLAQDVYGLVPNTAPVTRGGMAQRAIPINLMPALQPAFSDIDFTFPYGFSTFIWDAGEIRFADGTLGAFNAGKATCYLDNDIHYLYYTVGALDLSETTVFSETIGVNKVIVAIFQRSQGDAVLERPKIVQPNGKDMLIVGHLSAITANMGLLTAGEIRVGTGTLGSGPGVLGFTGWRMWMEGSVGVFGGYKANAIGVGGETLQYYSDTLGNLVCGGGSVLLNANGITIGAFSLMVVDGGKAGIGAQFKNSAQVWFTDADGATHGTVLYHSPGEVGIPAGFVIGSTYAPAGLIIQGFSTLYLDHLAEIGPYHATAGSNRTLFFRTKDIAGASRYNAFSPSVNNFGTLGDVDHYWYCLYTNNISATGTVGLAAGKLILPTSADAPGSPLLGMIYYDTNEYVVRVYDPTQGVWGTITPTW